ncbi:MAG: phosphoglycerate kinase [Proteobacteria bacterium]|nr:phosphoglycerate kinase [Pseudomonadota bacterium]
MGLDMYAYTTALTLTQTVDFADPASCDELHYWRKHPDLHGWMQRLYDRKGGKDPDFNGSFLMLDLDDLAALEADVSANRLPKTSGFFFGASDGSEREDDLAFIAKARKAISRGKTVFYYASW